MKKKLGWFELTQDKELGYEGLIVGIFSTKWRAEEVEPDCYYPDIILALKSYGNDGRWYISEMKVTNPDIKAFSELAIRVLKGIEGHGYFTLNEITANLSRYLEDKIPDHLAW